MPDSEQTNGEKPREQLRMVWPQSLLSAPPSPHVPGGYSLRCYGEADEGQYLELMGKAGFDGWDHDRLAKTLESILPDGFFVVVHCATGRLVATAMATHRPLELHPYGGELGWVAGDPDHSGMGLGMTVCAAATARFIQAGYRNIYLRTDDWRLPAIKTYLKLGYEPLLFRDDMAERWQHVCEQLSWPVPQQPR
jgi:mycothiol synthase